MNEVSQIWTKLHYNTVTTLRHTDKTLSKHGCTNKPLDTDKTLSTRHIDYTMYMY